MAEPADRNVIAAESIGRGRRHLVVKDYSSACEELSQACEILTDLHGATADECGECYLLYAKALLGCAREEAKIVDISEPANGDASQDSGSETDNAEALKNGSKNEVTKNGDDKAQNNLSDTKEDSSKPGTSNDEKKSEEESNKTGDDDDEQEEDEGCAEGDGDGDADSVTSDVSSLQLAWEVLEIASNIFTRQGAAAQGLLAEVCSELGEVSLESGNFEIALKDFTRGLELLESLAEPKPREIAEAHFKIGLTQALLNAFEEAKVEFNKAIEIIDKIIEDEATKQNDEGDKELIAELKQTKEDILLKIADVQESKEQSIEAVREQLRKVVPTTADGAGPSSNVSFSSPEKKDNKPAADISHLVKRKRNPGETEDADSAVPAKKATP